MNNVAVWQLIRLNSGLIALLSAGVLALGIAALLFLHHRAKRRKHELQGLASCWLATLSELSTSLDVMRDVTHRLILNRQRPRPPGTVYNTDVLMHRWLREGFMVMVMTSGQDCRGLVKSMEKDLVLFNWNINQATSTRLRGHGIRLSNPINREKLQKLVDVFDNAAIRLACNRHSAMVDKWRQSVELLNGFCLRNQLLRGYGLEAPGGIPLEWQMDEAKAWMIKDLAPVGEANW